MSVRKCLATALLLVNDALRGCNLARSALALWKAVLRDKLSIVCYDLSRIQLLICVRIEALKSCCSLPFLAFRKEIWWLLVLCLNLFAILPQC